MVERADGRLSRKEQRSQAYPLLVGQFVSMLHTVKDRPLCNHALVLPRRWGVDCTLVWVGPNRRLSTNDEGLASTKEAWSYLAMTQLMVTRLAPCGLLRHALEPGN